MNIIESIISGLIVAFLTIFLPWLSYKYHSVYLKISPVLSRVAFTIVIAVLFYNFGIYKTFLTLSAKQVGGVNLFKEIDALLVPLVVVIAGYFFIVIYLTVLDNLPYILRNKKENSPK